MPHTDTNNPGNSRQNEPQVTKSARSDTIQVGGKCLRSISAHADLIERETGIRSIVGVPHYSRSNANVHKRDAERYRRLVHEALGLVTEEAESGAESSGKTRSTK
ncbi:hypothetical protein [Agrococcus sp. KRD186]|uniref:hypothetical protein n=1 Tax=Agrococcus sp. KRD186 TaxID=2729730 RepID=UPI0019D04607|nr:hypothetical protein [Agrococcus sp. KRD186]